MAESTNIYYILPNDRVQGYDILKRDGVLNPDGTTMPEKICTIYSMEYLQPMLATLREVDGVVEVDNSDVIHPSPIYEE
jgi:hypothetical protein